jgi:predicted RNA-binding Zn ribbon-like protein
MTATGGTPGSESRRALERLIGFVNTNDVQASEDRLRGPDETRSWLVAEGFEAGELDHDDWATIFFREGVRAAAAANNGYGVDADAVAALRGAVDRLGFTVRVGADAGLEVASASPAGRALAPLVGALMAAQADGSWARVKACARDSCRWLFYDTTRNRSRTWCTNSTCGSREKAKRAYRRQLQRRTPDRSSTSNPDADPPTPDNPR